MPLAPIMSKFFLTILLYVSQLTSLPAVLGCYQVHYFGIQQNFVSCKSCPAKLTSTDTWGFSSETDVKALSCTYDKEILTIKLQVHSAFGDDYIRNLTKPFDEDLMKGPHNDTTGGPPQIIPTEHKTSEVAKNTSTSPLPKARGIRIKTHSGLYLRACGRHGTVSAVTVAGEGELWLAERINDTAKYAFRSLYGQYLTAYHCDKGIRANRNIALALEVWTIQKLFSSRR